MKRRHILFLTVGLGFLMSPASAQFDRARAETNYVAVARGEKNLASLSLVELHELAVIDREIRDAARRPTLRAEQRCRLAQLRASPQPTDLELRMVDLKCSGR